MNQSPKFDIVRQKPESLWQLRQQMDITSICADDYKNDLGIEESTTRDFFRGYLLYIESCAEESVLWDEVVLGIQDEVKDGLLVGCTPSSIQFSQAEFYRNLIFQRFDNMTTFREFFEIYEFEESLSL